MKECQNVFKLWIAIFLNLLSLLLFSFFLLIQRKCPLKIVIANGLFVAILTLSSQHRRQSSWHRSTAHFIMAFCNVYAFALASARMRFLTCSVTFCLSLQHWSSINITGLLDQSFCVNAENRHELGNLCVGKDDSDLQPLWRKHSTIHFAVTLGLCLC